MTQTTPFKRLVSTTIAMRALGIILLAIVLPNTAQALEFECRVNTETRYIRIDLPGKEHLCEVNVAYQTGDERVLWHADNDSLYCSAKAYDLRQKYVDTWDFVCTEWPDRDGIDKLSARNRYILDTEIKTLIKDGKTAEQPFTVTGVKTESSSSLDEVPGTLALQYFLTDDFTGNIRDLTEVIVDDGSSWKVIARINDLASQVGEAAGAESDPNLGEEYRVDAALIQSISDQGVLDITTTINTTSDETAKCYGNQVLQIESDGSLATRTPHRYVCSADASG